MNARHKGRRAGTKKQITRDTLLFATGLGGAIFEILFEQADRPGLLTLLAGMMGLPLYLRMDEKGRSRDKHDAEEDGDA